MKNIIFAISAGILLSLSIHAYAAPWLYLGEGKESKMPDLKKAIEVIAKQPECIKVTEGTWGETGKDIDIPGKKGFMFRATCEVGDLPAWPYDNFWVAPGETKRSSIYRQRKKKFLSEN